MCAFSNHLASNLVAHPSSGLLLFIMAVATNGKSIFLNRLTSTTRRFSLTMRLGAMEASTYTREGVPVEYGSCTGVDAQGDRVSMAFFGEAFAQNKSKLQPGMTVYALHTEILHIVDECRVCIFWFCVCVCARRVACVMPS